MNAPDIRVVIVDDEPLVRTGLCAIVDSEPGLSVVGEAGDGAEALARCRSVQPDVVCLDVRMPGVDGLRATKLIRRLDHPPKVLVVTTFSSDEYVLAAHRAGAAGFVLKRASAEELVTAIRTVYAGDSLLYPAAVRDLVTRFGRAETYAGEPLTPRERQVLGLMAQGWSNAVIAEQLVLGVETVRTHVAAVLRKLSARDRTHAVVLALSQGLVELPDPG